MQIQPYTNIHIANLLVAPFITEADIVYVIEVELQLPHEGKSGVLGRTGFIKAVYNEGDYFTISDFDWGAAWYATEEEAYKYADMLQKHIVHEKTEIDREGYLDGYTNLCDDIKHNN